MHQTDLTIEQLDTDGALREAADRVEGHTRRGAITGGLLVAGGMAGGSALLGAFTSSASAQSNTTDVAILNFALTLEYLEAAFYAQAAAGGALSGDAKRFAEVAGAHEAAHVKALQAVLGTQAVPTPTFDFKGTTSTSSTFLKTAVTLEDTGVAAYKGQAPLVIDPKVLASALAIHSVEAKHATWARHLAGDTLIPVPRDKPMTQQQVLAAVAAPGFIVG